ncbi:Hypothetical predicted protein [Pelobates cultripes]|uniref:Uncharacterized protein n=1 Tax=Pelobates cultripes TaxID=61616 RepID=A0AAD1W4P5_PELCU|nr:Hypothetical predicted protein [Pelobates cultripes]
MAGAMCADGKGKNCAQLVLTATKAAYTTCSGRMERRQNQRDSSAQETTAALSVRHTKKRTYSPEVTSQTVKQDTSAGRPTR